MSTFIHHKAKLTFGKNMVATGPITSVAKMNQSYLPGDANVHSFHHLSEQISLSHYTVPQVSVFYIARNIDETLTYNSVGVTTLNFNFFAYYFFEKNMRKSLKTHIKFFKSTFIHRKPKLTFGKKTW